MCSTCYRLGAVHPPPLPPLFLPSIYLVISSLFCLLRSLAAPLRFVCCDLDGDSRLAPQEMRHFYKMQLHRVTSLVRPSSHLLILLLSNVLFLSFLLCLASSSIHHRPHYLSTPLILFLPPPLLSVPRFRARKESTSKMCYARWWT